MRTCLALVGLFVLVPYLHGDEDGKDLLEEAQKIVSDMTKILKTVKDKDSAETALPKLKPLDKRLLAMVKKVDGMKPEEQERVGKKLEAEAKGMVSEFERLEAIPEVKALFLKELPFFARVEGRKVRIARTQINSLETAVESYKILNGAYPNSLKTLTEGEKAPLAVRHLLDPWGKPYQFDAAGPKHKGKRPDIWTVTPDKKVVGNWDAKK